MYFKDPEKTPTAVGFQPFSAVHTDEEDKEGNVRDNTYCSIYIYIYISNTNVSLYEYMYM